MLPCLLQIQVPEEYFWQRYFACVCATRDAVGAGPLFVRLSAVAAAEDEVKAERAHAVAHETPAAALGPGQTGGAGTRQEALILDPLHQGGGAGGDKLMQPKPGSAGVDPAADALLESLTSFMGESNGGAPQQGRAPAPAVPVPVGAPSALGKPSTGQGIAAASRDASASARVAAAADLSDDDVAQLESELGLSKLGGATTADSARNGDRPSGSQGKPITRETVDLDDVDELLKQLEL